MARQKEEAIMQIASAAFPRHSIRAVSSPRERTQRRGLLRRIFTRRQPTLYQRCLAVHIASAGHSGALR
jgi:hypothetical protein